MSTAQPAGTVLKGCTAGLFVLLLSTCLAGTVRGQSVNIEWLEFETNGQRFLVLNAYEPDSASSESASTQIFPLFVELPLAATPHSPEANAFLDALEYVADSSSSASRWRPQTVASWEKLLHDLTTRTNLWIHGREITSSEISDVRKAVYAAQGYPSEEDPVFPHLTRGVLAALDAEGNALASIDFAFDSGSGTSPQYRIVRFANVGSKPVDLVESGGLFSGYVSGTQISLGPGEHIRRLIRFKPSVFSMVTGKSSGSIRYIVGDSRISALRLNGIHQDAVTNLPRSMAAAVGLSSISWGDIALYHILFALAGVCVVILLMMTRSFAPTIAVRAGFSPLDRDDISSTHYAFTLHSLNDVFRDSISNVSNWKTNHVSPSIDRFTRFVRNTAPSIDRSRADVVLQEIKERFTRLAADTREFSITWKIKLHQLAVNVYLYREINTEYIEPIDGRECVDVIRQLSLDVDSSDASSTVASKRLRTEAGRLARRLGGDLDHELMPPTTTNFQILWALRLLAKMPARSSDELQVFMNQWLRGADHVLAHEGREGVGPTIPEFMRLNV